MEIGQKGEGQEEAELNNANLKEENEVPHSEGSNEGDGGHSDDESDAHWRST